MSHPSTNSIVSLGIGIGFASSLVGIAWSLVNPVYGESHPYMAVALACAGVLALSRTLRGSSERPGRLRFLIKALACAAFVAMCVPTLDALVTRLEIHMRSFGGISILASPLLNFLGIDAVAERGLLHVQHGEGVVSYLPSMEKIGLRYSVIAIALYLMFRLFTGTNRLVHAAGNALIILVGVTAVRFALSIVVSFEFSGILSPRSGIQAISVLSGHLVNSVSLCCLGVLLDKTAGRTFRTAQIPAHVTVPPAFRYQSFAVAVLLGTVVGFGLYCEPPGKLKAGRVLVDDRFCGIWEPTARLLDTEWYGDFSTYSFGGLTEWLGHWYSMDVNTESAYTDEYLSKYDVLIIKTPVIEIPAQEVEAINRFVESGGGLLLVGDHTNLLGMGTHINALCARHGITFLYDAVSSAQTRGFVKCPGKWLGRPVASLHVENLEFMTSCSLDIDFHAQPVVVGTTCRREPHDYAGGSFFGKSGPHPELAHGTAVLAATVRAGKGQIAAFTDSTVWSSFAVFQYDREKLAADIVNQLIRERSWLRMPLRIAASLTLAGVIVLLIWWKQLANFALWFGGLTGIWFGVFLTDQFHRVVYDPGPPNAPINEVSFLWDGGSCAFPPVLGGIGSLPMDRAFDTLFVSVQRMGFVPRVAWKYEEVLTENTRAVFLVAPVNPPPDEVITALREFVDDGGLLVIMDDKRLGGRGCAARYLQEFGASVRYEPMKSGEPGVHSRLIAMEQIRNVPSPDVFIAQRIFGKGRVLYLRESSEFSRIGLKHCFARPSREVRQRYDTVFYILSLIPDWNKVDRRFYGI